MVLLLGRGRAHERQRAHGKSLEARSGETGECCYVAVLGRNIDLQTPDAPIWFARGSDPKWQGFPALTFPHRK